MKKIIINACYVLFAMSLFNTAGVQAQEKKDSLVNVAFGTVAREDLLGAVSTVNISELMKKSYSTYSLDGLQSFVGGYNGNIWGQGGLILVDGIPRSVYDVQSSQIESVTVLKGASAVVLYGSKAAKGVILITTKRGKAEPMRIHVRANTGIYLPKAYPKYLNAADYMTLYNEASVNDGKTAPYTQDQIDNTKAGTNPYKYPDIDFYSSDYLRKFISKTEATGEVTGGNQYARYYTNFGLSTNNSLVKYGYHAKDKDFNFNIKANVDMNLNSWLKASTNATVIFADNYTGRGDLWGASSSLRPNWVSPLVPISMLDSTNSKLQTYVNNSNHIVDGKYLLGGTSINQTNAFSDGYAAGYVKNKNRTFMFDVKVGADLGKVLKGLTFNTSYGMDYRDFYSEGFNVGYATYEPIWGKKADGTTDVITDLTKYSEDGNSNSETIGATNYTQTLSFNSQFNYNRTFAQDHNVSAALIAWGFQVQSSADVDHLSGSASEIITNYYHRTSNANLGFQATYNFRHKYYLDFAGAEVYSAKLPEGGRAAFSPTVTLGYRISKENFFKNNVSFVDDLKLTASYANLHQDIDISQYYMYQGYYNNKGGWYQWRDGLAGGNTTSSVRGTNNDLTYIQRKEFRVGLEASLLKQAVVLDANFFTQNTNGMLTQGASTIYPSYYSAYSPYLNYNNDKRTGADFTLNINQKIGNVQGTLGFTGMYFTSEAVRRDEVYTDAYQYRVGKALDAAWGYTCEGFFSDQADIDAHAKQSFGIVRPGDLKYKDENNDGVVDSKDAIYLGRYGWSATPLTLGVNLTLKWKNLTFFAMGTGNFGGIGFKNGTYYQATGNNKYSDIAWGRWTEATQTTATYPRLTTEANFNNYLNSNFWMYKTDRFDLSRVQVTYDLPESVLKSSFIHGLSVYLNGGNLLTISKERKLMETNIGSAPQYRSFNLGLKASF